MSGMAANLGETFKPCPASNEQKELNAMRRKIGIFTLVLLSAALLLASCGTAKDTAAIKVLDQGTIVAKEGNRLLITAYVEKEGAAHIDAFWFTINDKSDLQNGNGETIKPEELEVGAQVEAWNTGVTQESYPAQTDAAKIVVLGEPDGTPADLTTQAEALKAALQEQSESSAAWAVKAVSLDEESGYWDVELVKHETINEPVSVRVDARSGQVVPVPVAENSAFRLFAPEPGTEASPGFTVEGEARVFEAAFSWQLEDGHVVLAEGHETAGAGAPEWGRFQFNVDYDKATQPNMMLILFVHSAKDGSIEHELVVPLKVPESNIDYTLE